MMSPDDFNTKGYCLVEHFLSEHECKLLLASIAEYRKHYAVPEIYRNFRERPLHYSVIEGEPIRLYLPKVLELYHEVNRLVNRVAYQELVPLEDERVACNINITPKGGTYRWHYDRNAVTAILYLNESSGGETECYPNYRLFLHNARYSRFQQWLDRLLQISWMRRFFGKQLVVKPHPGRLFIMRGNRCLHSVRPVTGEGERINIIMTFDVLGANFAVAGKLDPYLYSKNPAPPSDPNYAVTSVNGESDGSS